MCVGQSWGNRQDFHERWYSGWTWDCRLIITGYWVANPANSQLAIIVMLEKRMLLRPSCATINRRHRISLLRNFYIYTEPPLTFGLYRKFSNFVLRPFEDALDIIIVGAGLSGLATAISSALSGHNVVIFESAVELQEFGAGLQITPNSSRLLRTWNLSDKFWKSVAEPTYLAVHRYSDGKVLALEDDFNKKIRFKYESPYVNVHRVDLHLALADKAKQLGVKLHLGQRVTNIDFNIPSIETETGLKARADLIVAADGIWSTCRNLTLDIKDFPRPTGDLAYRIVLTLDDIDDPELKEMVQRPSCNFWIGPGSHVVAYSVRGGTMYNIVLLVPDDLPEGARRQPGSIEQMRAIFDGWDPMLNRFLKLVKSVQKWKLMHRRELPSWVNDKSNCVFVRGDSCHPMLPYLAQGANSAMEDGAVLGLLLGSIKKREQLPKALKMYQDLRKARGDAIVKETFKQRDSFHMRDGPEQQARDELFLSQLGKELKGPFPSRWTCPRVQPWLYGYDAYEEVREAVSQDPFE
ncbi:putative FAD binding domain-containing protein [Rosellinia necatrix]|uniref:Putative FAD binding domain-containing protein n=1 Tax=Rosellinia necatrix TaxID=77044 RepID=A0A1W2TR34_ROSNE|nr:putative FAD binding domain-containing protein [Rosellinia necatrix]